MRHVLQDVICHTDCARSAAELRAAAAERRLLGLAGPSTSVKHEDDTLVTMKDDSDTEEEQPDVPDPHMGIEERKREMEAEMNDEERTGLRTGFEEFIKTEPDARGTGVKRELRDDSANRDLPAAKKRPPAKPSFGADIVRQERLRGMGMAQTTLTSTASTLGGMTSQGQAPVPIPLDSPQSPGAWACQVCTFVNIPDHGRCGKISSFARSAGPLLIVTQKCVRPDLTARCPAMSLLDEGPLC